ncbi:hyphal wall protein 2-like [Microcaecilia unicolor]|uniref:Hyphal wall protein 2-like n=1 Tax=Microcaecilia unicolor TaxID=1415580 RepID=A0A6P7XS96_9AMPH|nr:hyphal wall protein 2-like [Microcaecilia unicolor]
MTSSADDSAREAGNRDSENSTFHQRATMTSYTYTSTTEETNVSLPFYQNVTLEPLSVSVEPSARSTTAAAHKTDMISGLLPTSMFITLSSPSSVIPSLQTTLQTFSVFKEKVTTSSSSSLSSLPSFSLEPNVPLARVTERPFLAVSSDQQHSINTIKSFSKVPFMSNFIVTLSSTDITELIDATDTNPLSSVVMPFSTTGRAKLYTQPKPVHWKKNQSSSLVGKSTPHTSILSLISRPVLLLHSADSFSSLLVAHSEKSPVRPLFLFTLSNKSFSDTKPTSEPLMLQEGRNMLLSPPASETTSTGQIFSSSTLSSATDLTDVKSTIGLAASTFASENTAEISSTGSSINVSLPVQGFERMDTDLRAINNAAPEIPVVDNSHFDSTDAVYSASSNQTLTLATAGEVGASNVPVSSNANQPIISTVTSQVLYSLDTEANGQELSATPKARTNKQIFTTEFLSSWPADWISSVSSKTKSITQIRQTSSGLRLVTESTDALHAGLLKSLMTDIPNHESSQINLATADDSTNTTISDHSDTSNPTSEVSNTSRMSSVAHLKTSARNEDRTVPGFKVAEHFAVTLSSDGFLFMEYTNLSSPPDSHVSLKALPSTVDSISERSKSIIYGYKPESVASERTKLSPPAAKTTSINISESNSLLRTVPYDTNSRALEDLETVSSPAHISYPFISEHVLESDRNSSSEKLTSSQYSHTAFTKSSVPQSSEQKVYQLIRKPAMFPMLT